MGDSILRVFKLVLGIFSKLTPNAFHKSLKIAAIFAEKDLKFFLEYNNIRPCFLSMPAFVLWPASSNTVFKKKSRK